MVELSHEKLKTVNAASDYESNMLLEYEQVMISEYYNDN